MGLVRITEHGRDLFINRELIMTAELNGCQPYVTWRDLSGTMRWGNKPDKTTAAEFAAQVLGPLRS